MSLSDKKNISISTIITCFFVFISFKIPLTYDEVWNYSNIASKGTYYAITNYPAPNNHVFFSIIQSILIGKNILQINPFLLRIGNILVIFLFILFLLKVFEYYQLNKKIYPFYIFSLIFSSQLVTTYFLIARGYLLGTFLCLVGIFYWMVKERKIGLIFLALSAWTVPTFCFIWPGLFIYKSIKNRKITSNLEDALLLSLMTLVFYLPVIKQLIINRDKWVTFPNINDFYVATFISSNNFKNIYISITTLLVIAIFTFFNKNKKIKEINLILLSSIISYLGTISLFKIVNISNLPFSRNGIFIPFFIILQMIFLIKSSGKKITKTVIYFFLLINTLIGVTDLYRYILYKNNYEAIKILTPTALISADKNLLKDSRIIIYYDWPAEPMAEFYANIYNLQIQKPSDDYNICDIGKILPSKNEKITLVNKSDQKISLCY